MTTEDEENEMYTRMDSNPKFPIGSSFNNKCAVIVDNYTNGWDNIPFSARGMTARKWNIGLGDIVVSLKKDYERMLNIVYEADSGGRMFGKIPVIANLAGLPAGTNETVFGWDGAPDSEKNEAMIQRLIANVRFVGISEGNYRNEEGPQKSPLQDGINLSCMGPNTVMLPTSEEIEPFSDCILWAEKRSSNSLSDQSRRVVPTIKQFKPDRACPQMKRNIGTYLHTYHDTDQTSFYKISEKAVVSDVAYRNEVRIGHRNISGVLGMIFRFLMYATKAGVQGVQGVQGGGVQGGGVQGGAIPLATENDIKEFAKMMGITQDAPNGKDDRDKRKAVLEAVMDTDKIVMSTNDYLSNFMYNADEHLAQSYAEMIDQQYNIIGKVITQRPSKTQYRGGNMRIYDVFWKI